MNQRSTWLLWLKIFGVLGMLAAGFAFLATIKVIFIPLLLAVVLNVLLAPLVANLERRGAGRSRSVAIVFGLFMLVLSGLGVGLAELAGSEIDAVKQKWPEARARMVGLLESTQNVINERVPEDKRVDLTEVIPQRIDAEANKLMAELPHIVSEGVIGIALIFVFSFFLLRDGRSLKKAIVAAVPNRYFEMTLSILYRVNQQVSNYLRGLTFQAIADTVVATLLCFALGIPNALLVGLIVGSTTVMPVVGLVISGVLGPLIAIFGGSGDPLTLTLAVIAIIGVTHLIDNLMVAPLIMGHSVHMHPILVIVSLVLAGKFFGMLGIVLAIPTVSVLMVLVQEGYRGIKSNEYYLKTVPR